MSNKTSGRNREIVTVNVGGCGVNLGQATLEHLCVEQGISASGSAECKTKYGESISISFQETSKGKYYARALFFDLDPYSINMTKTLYRYNNVLRDSMCISGKADVSNNFAAGHYTTGKCFIDTFNDRLRLMVEECANIQGFIINHSVCGGSGAGTGALVMERIAVDYRRKCKFGNCVFPDDRKLTSIIQIYNTLLCFHWLLDHLEISIILDNWKLDEICRQMLDIKTPKYKHYNALCSTLISTITAKYRFALGEDMNIFARDMVPFPRLHFLSSSLSPIINKRNKRNANFKNNIQALTDQCLNYKHFFQRFGAVNDCYDVEEDKFMSMALFYKGSNINADMMNVNQSMRFMRNNVKFKFVDWSATNKPSVKYIECPLVSLKSDDIMTGDKMVAMVGNNTAFSRVLSERTTKKYDLLYSQRAFVHHLVGHGMEEGELAEAREDLAFLEKDYLDVLSTQDLEDSDDY